MRLLSPVTLAFTAAMTLIACGVEPSSKNNTGTHASSASGSPSTQHPSSSCSLPSDQQNSLMASLPDTRATYTIKMDSDFSSIEREKIERAIEIWNDLGLKRFRRILWRYETAAFDPLQKTKILDGCSTPNGIDQGVFILKDTHAQHWSELNLSLNNMAATLRCVENNKLTRQIVLVNTTLIDERQLTSVILHEMGHMIGLNHSCDDQSQSTAADYLGCHSIATQPQHPYRVAVMYPTLRAASLNAPHSAAAAPEIKEILQSNDELRSSCLLSPP